MPVTEIAAAANASGHCASDAEHLPFTQPKSPWKSSAIRPAVAVRAAMWSM